MKYFDNELSEQHKELSEIIRKKDSIENAKKLFLDIHAKLHMSSVSHRECNQVDDLLKDLDAEEYAIMPTSKDETIAWAVWHISRLEDLTINILVNNGNQIFDSDWKKNLNVSITDTGNALTDDEIMCLSKEINIVQLLEYRNEVGKQTRKIVAELTDEEMKRKVSEEGIQKILSEGGVTKQEESIWLLDFWKKKDVAGILLMPPTRDAMMHLNDCCKWKIAIRNKKKFYRTR